MSKFSCFFLSMVFMFSFLTADYPSREFTKPGNSLNQNQIPLYFSENRGEVHQAVKFYTRASGFTLWATSNRLTFDQHLKVSGNKTKRIVYQMSFPGSSIKTGNLHSVTPMKCKQNLIRKKGGRNVHTTITTSRAIQYDNLFSNIDLKVYGKHGKVEYDWVVKPMADPSAIRFRYEGAKSTCIESSGNITIRTEAGKQIHSRPVAYQIIDGKQKSVDVNFRKISSDTYGFKTGAYDRNHALIIDPVVLVYSGYVGGSHIYEYNYGFYSDNNGKLYVTGCTVSGDYPFSNPMDTTIQSGNHDIFISVIDTNQGGSNSLVYSTVLGGDGVDAGYGIYADTSGIIYLSGVSSDGSINNGFPTTNGGHTNGSYDLLFAKIDPNLTGMSQLLIARLYGGTGRDRAKGIAVRNYNEIYISGLTASNSGFPVTSTAYSSTKKGSYDYFLMRLDQYGNIQYCSYIGGSNYGDEDRSYVPLIASTSDSKVYMTAHTRATDFPVKNAYQSTMNGAADGIIALFDTYQSGAASLVCSTYFGGVGWDQINNLYVGSGNTLYITGTTESMPGTGLFPVTTGAYQTTKKGTYDAFIAKMSLNGSQLTNNYCTYFGGTGTETGRAITVNSSGHILLGGATKGNDFPLVNSYQGATYSYYQGFVSLLDISSGGQGLIFSTCIGGSKDDHVKHVNFAPNGRLLTGGVTKSTNYPVSGTPYQSNLEGPLDTFVSLIDPN